MLKQRLGKFISKDFLLILEFLISIVTPSQGVFLFFFSFRPKYHTVWGSQLYAVMYYPLLNPLVL